MRPKLAVALGTVYLVWGSTYLAIAVADRTLPPLLMLSVRFLHRRRAPLRVVGAGAATSRPRGPAGASGARRPSSGGLLLVVDTGGVAWAEQRVADRPGRAARSRACRCSRRCSTAPSSGSRLPLGAVAGIAAGLLGVGLLVGAGGRIDAARHRSCCSSRPSPGRRARLYARVAPLPRKPFLSAAMQMLCARRDARRRSAPRPARSAQRPSRRDLACVARRGSRSSSSSARSCAFTAYGWLLRNVSTPRALDLRLREPGGRRPASAGSFMGEHVGGKEIAAGLVILASVGLLLFARAPGAGRRADAGVAAAVHPRKDAQAKSFRSAPRLAELRRIAA